MEGRKTLKSRPGRRNTFAVLVFLALLGLVSAANGRTITVDDDGPADFDNIQAAIDDANTGDIIEVQLGTYTGTGNRDIDFLGKAITVRSTDPNDSNIVDTTIIDCNGSESNQHRGFKFYSGEGPNSVVNGLTVINGFAPKKWIAGKYYYYGGGILCDGSSPTISNCNISASTARDDGGGIYCKDSNPIITNSNMSKNKAHDYGGGIHCNNSNPTITNCDISENIAHDGGGGIYYKDSNPIITDCTITSNFVNNDRGGGIYCLNCNFTINNCIINNNEAYSSGGGIWCGESNSIITDCIITGNSAGSGCGVLGYNSQIVINNCDISENLASSEHGYGGGIYCWPGSLTISNSAINNNTVGKDGGGIYCWEGTPAISNCTITNNTAGHYGGGGLIASNGLITNCIISGNKATRGGGLAECPCSIINCMISDNSVERDGGGLFRCYGSITNCTIINNKAQPPQHGYEGYGGGLYECTGLITNCIIWNNFADYGPQLYNSAEPNYSCIQDWSGGGGQGNINSDPCFAFAADYHIILGSPCIDAGDPNYVAEPNETDVDGNPRVLDGDSDTNYVIDMGAYEYNPSSPSIAISFSTFSFSCVQGWEKPVPQVLLIRNCGGGVLNWQIIEDCNWLKVAPANGVSAGEINEVTLSVDQSSLTTGFYSCTLTILDPNVINSPVSIDVEVHVGALLRVPEDFATIQAAIDAADDFYDMVLVADGTYTGEGNKNLDFKGKAITVRSENGPNNCIIDCEESGYGFYIQSREAEEPIVEGFTITNGRAGIRCMGSSPTIKNCVIINSSLNGIWCSHSRPVISGCTISNNESGILCEESNAIISHCIVNGNWNSSLGGIFCTGTGNLTINDCTVSNNAGGIFCEGDATITNCIVTDNLDCGIECYNRGSPSSPTINNCIITGNSNGGILCWKQSNPKIANCIISGNTAGYYGTGGIYYGYSGTNYHINGSVTNCTISNNIGDGIFFKAKGSLTITDCNISDNNGSGISSGNENSLLRIENCNISNNSGGSGIICQEGSLTITNCTITDNSGGGPFGYGGGIWWAGENKAIITNCKITGNRADDAGGVFCFGGSIIIENCIINNNLATYTNSYGGGVFCRGNTEIKNSTLCSNSSEKYGGSIWVYEGYCSITNCILWDNTADQGSQIFAGNPYSSQTQGTVTVAYSDVQGGQSDIYVAPGHSLDWGAGNIDSDPCFVEAGYWADVNDPNIIVEPNDPNAIWIEGDYHLLEGSPCIDAGDPNYIAGPNETDLDGNPRVVDGDNDGNSVVDMGVYEYRPPTPAELAAELMEGVGGLELPRGIENGLEVKLNAALRALEDENENNDIAAINTLGAFINAVEAQCGKKLPEAEADALIAAAEEIIELLSGE